MSAIFCALVMNTVLADEQENTISEDLILLLEKTEKVLKVKHPKINT